MSASGSPQWEGSLDNYLDGSHTPKDSGILASCRTQATKIRDHVLNSRSKSSSDRSSAAEQPAVEEHGCKQRSDEAEAQERLRQREAAEAARAEHKQLLKQRAKQYRSDKHARKADEKARNRYMGGVAWGFDPTAGIRVSEDKTRSISGCWVFGGRTGNMRGQTGAGADEHDDLGRRTGRRWDSEGTWGVEAGGPGKEGKFGHGSLRNKPSNFVAMRGA